MMPMSGPVRLRSTLIFFTVMVELQGLEYKVSEQGILCRYKTSKSMHKNCAQYAEFIAIFQVVCGRSAEEKSAEMDEINPAMA